MRKEVCGDSGWEWEVMLLRPVRQVQRNLVAQVWVFIMFCDTGYNSYFSHSYNMRLDPMTLKVLSVRNGPVYIHQI